MKKEQDYIRDITEIRSMMERSSKFLSLSGWAGILAGMFALAGAFIAYRVLEFNPTEIYYSSLPSRTGFSDFQEVILLALAVLVLALGSAVYHSYKAAGKRGEKLWNPTSKRLLAHMAVPFFSGALLIVILVSKGLIGLAAPLSLIFYGLALFNAGKFTYAEVRFLGLVQIGLGLLGAWFIEFGLMFWAVGFGVAHILYGIYMHYRYER